MRNNLEFFGLVKALLFVVVLCFNLVEGSKVHYLENVNCSLQSTVVATDSKFYPFFVLLNRCLGSDWKESPLRKKCVASEKTDITIRGKDVLALKNKVFVVANHTACKTECTLKPSDCSPHAKFEDCQCKCPTSLKHGMECGPKKVWNFFTCRCLCKTPNKDCCRRKFFNESTCACQCKKERAEYCAKKGMGMDKLSCKCLEPVSGQSGGPILRTREKDIAFWICLMVAVFTIVVLGFQAFLYYKKDGFIYKISRRYRRKVESKNMTKNCKPEKSSRIVDEADQYVYFEPSRCHTLDGKPM